MIEGLQARFGGCKVLGKMRRPGGGEAGAATATAGVVVAIEFPRARRCIFGRP